MDGTGVIIIGDDRRISLVTRGAEDARPSGNGKQTPIIAHDPNLLWPPQNPPQIWKPKLRHLHQFSRFQILVSLILNDLQSRIAPSALTVTNSE